MEQEKNNKSETALKEEKILAFWKERGIFEKTLQKESPKGEFVFYEGPPTANAAPALHHIESRAFKDIIPRYKTMQGFHVRRKGGWDTHGLPVELQIEKKLGLKSKKEIETYGIAEFNRQCRESVWEYMDVWKKFTERIGYWVDEKNAYVTYHNSYIESLWNIVSHVHDRELMYKDYKVVPWCPRCGTALSSHELAQGYQDITDISVYVKFKLLPGQKFGEKKEFTTGESAYIVAWTTTPWTLPGNVGLAINPKISYTALRIDGVKELLIIATELVEKVFVGHTVEVVHTCMGEGLTGLSYEPLYPFMQQLAVGVAREKMQNAFKVYSADFVTTTDGTGVVHTAVMYGQEDFDLGTKVGLPKFHLVSPDGTFIPGTGFLAGRFVRETNENGKPTLAIDIIDDLKKRGLFFKQENIKHSYPHCWRCKTALIYYARDSWYISMSTLRGELQAENEKINWEPSHIKEGRFGEWLKEAKDWAISRERYWGTPLPVWESESGKRLVVNSIDELKQRSKKSGNTYLGIRHGEADHNVLGVWSGRKDVAHHLTATGKAEVLTLAEQLQKQLDDKKADYIFVSPFLRTKETAEIIAKKLGVQTDKIIFDDRLVEWSIGIYDGKQMEDYFKLRREQQNPYEFEPEGGESYRNIIKRVGEFLCDIESKYSGKTILIVSHGGVLRAMNFVAAGISMENEKYMRDEFKNYALAEAREIPFVSLPHNEYFELDLHRPYIDTVVLVDESGEEYTRVKEVMDVWFDSGSMPFAQDHYPFENKEWVDGPGYPADFISEAIDQTRGWFYTLLCVGVLMERGNPYKNVICLGHILDKEGKKMSKSIGNIVNPWVMMDTYGVDALRLWMYSVNQPGDSKNFDEKTVDEIVKKVFNPLTNSYILFSTYEKGIARVKPRESTHPLDIWIIAALDTLTADVTNNLDNFKLFEPVRAVKDFVQDFSTWYVRRSRDRLKDTNNDDVSQAVSVMEYVLIEMSKLLAPFAPFYADWLYQEVTKGTSKESVHLELWSVANPVPENLLEDMKKVREVVSKALELRQKAGVKVRQPLASLSIPQHFNLSPMLLNIIGEELNVKMVKIDSIVSDIVLDTNITDELRGEGIARDIVRVVQDARKKAGLSPSDTIELVVCADETIKKILTTYEKVITAPTQVKHVEYSTDVQKEVLSIEGVVLSFSIVK